MNIKKGTFCILNAYNLVPSFEMEEKSTVIPFDLGQLPKITIYFF